MLWIHKQAQKEISWTRINVYGEQKMINVVTIKKYTKLQLITHEYENKHKEMITNHSNSRDKGYHPRGVCKCDSESQIKAL